MCGDPILPGTNTCAEYLGWPATLCTLLTQSVPCLQLGFVVAMVTGIHFVEAYLLNPAIYSAHLKLHPLMVLTVLVVAEHSLGVWGLLLAGECNEQDWSRLCASACKVCGANSAIS